jgi:5'-3' exonuclease
MMFSTQLNRFVEDPDNQLDLLVFDMNALGYAAMYQPNLAKLKHKGMPTAALHGAMASLFSRMGEFPTAMPLVIWDGLASWRKEMLPEYKANRSDAPEKVEIRASYRKQVPYIQQLLMQLGIPQVRSGDAEADDIGGVICRALGAILRMELVTRDTDWWQGLDELVRWHSPLSKVTLTLADFMNPEVGTRDGHFLSTTEYICCKALAGDDSDCIPGVNKVGLKTAAKWIREYGSIEELWRRVDEKEVAVKGKIMESLVSSESRALYARNIQLMDWRKAPPIDSSQVSAFFMEPDISDFEALAGEFGLTRVISGARKQATEHRAEWDGRWKKVLGALGV